MATYTKDPLSIRLSDIQWAKLMKARNAQDQDLKNPTITSIEDFCKNIIMDYVIHILDPRPELWYSQNAIRCPHCHNKGIKVTCEKCGKQIEYVAEMYDPDNFTKGR